MGFNTGETITEIVLSLNSDNMALSAASFSQLFFIDGVSVTPIVTISLSDAQNGIFSASFSGNSYGMHQFELRNNLNGVLYISNAYNISATNLLDKNIYLGI